MNQYIFIAKESFFDHIRCIRDLGYCYWKKNYKDGKTHIQVGDVVFLFISDKIHNRVMYRMEVVDTDCARDDAKYWKTKFEPDDSCLKFDNISSAYTGTGMTRDELESHGISRYITKYKKLNKEQAAWLESYFVSAK